MLNKIEKRIKEKIKDIEMQLLFSKEKIKMPTNKNFPMEIKNKVFIHNSAIIHDNKYGYSLVDYQGALSKLIIICPIHGEFIQEASKHSRGAGCSLCFNDRNRITQDNFIEKAIKVHGLLYDYSLVVYTIKKQSKNNLQRAWSI